MSVQHRQVTTAAATAAGPFTYAGALSQNISDNLNNNNHHHYHHSNNNNSNNNRLSWPQIRNVNQPGTGVASGGRPGLGSRASEQQQPVSGRSRPGKTFPKDEANVMERANQIVMYVIRN